MDFWQVVAISAVSGAALAAVLASIGLRRTLWVAAGLVLLAMVGLIIGGNAAGGWEGLGYIAVAIGMALPAAGGIAVIAVLAWMYDRRRAPTVAAPSDDRPKGDDA